MCLGLRGGIYFLLILLMDIESQELVGRRHRQHEILRWVPVIGLSIGFYSAVFATFILYPWHLQLSSQFEEMRKTCLAG